MITIHRALPFAVALTFVAVSCGGSSDGGADDTVAPTTTEEPVADSTEDFTEVENTDEAVEPVEDTAVETVVTEPVAVETAVEPVEEPVDESTVGAAAAASIDVTMSEWEVDAPAEYTAGEITFNASNAGSFPHEFVVIEGEGYEALPLTDAGAVIEDDLPTGALIGRTDRIGGGSSEALTVTLAPGNYVLLCNLGGGGNSHAGQGQRLDITVA